MHKDIRKIRYNFLLENYSFQYKIYNIIGIVALFNNNLLYIKLKELKETKNTKCEFSAHGFILLCFSFIWLLNLKSIALDIDT